MHLYARRGAVAEWLEGLPLQGAEGLSSTQLVHGIFHEFNLFTQQSMGSRVSLEQG